MTFLRTRQIQVSRRNRSARSVRPALEGCESRQLMSGVQAAAQLASLCKMAPAAVCKMAPAALCKMAPASVAEVSGIMIKHGA